MTEITKMERQTAPAETRQPDSMLAMIERVLMAPDVPMDRITAMMDLRERQMDKEAEQAFNAAFAAAMADMPEVKRTGENKHLRRKYATLDDLIRAARPVLSKHGLSLNWQTGIDGETIWVRAVVRHALGHKIETEQRGPRDKGQQMNALQGGGSTETYLKRYTGFAILGLSSGDEVDDDGVGTGTISADQFQALRDLIGKAGADEGKLCAVYGVAMLHELPLSKYADADKKLRAKLAAKGGAA